MSAPFTHKLASYSANLLTTYLTSIIKVSNAHLPTTRVINLDNKIIHLKL